MVSVERFLQYMDVPQEELQGNISVHPNWTFHGQIEFHHVSLHYMPELPVAVGDISFTVEGGTQVGIIGRTGAGKSSVLNALFHLSPICEQGSPRQVLDACLEQDPDSKAACETCIKANMVMIFGEITTKVCSKGFQRDQNLQLHRRGHNLPWKLQKRNNHGVLRKKVYVYPEPTCVHHNTSRALGDLTGIKKHFCWKHREKRLKCPKCNKMYAVESDYKAHSKVCGTRETVCDCGRVFSRKDKYEIHKLFCDALAREAGKIQQYSSNQHHGFELNTSNDFRSGIDQQIIDVESPLFQENTVQPTPLLPPQRLSFIDQPNMAPTAGDTAYMSATAVFQHASTLGAGSISGSVAQMSRTLGVMSSSPPRTTHFGMPGFGPNLKGHKLAIWPNTDNLTRDFLGVSGESRN